ncbi:MAG TPA: hypothetical protein PKX07_18690 [Aggregatilineales bacterium]|nr:hypothetical protein [Aggregatilineales bacterium]
MTSELLRDCVAGVTPVDLLGMRLLKACPQPADLPRETLTQAVIEIIEYTGRCQAAAQRLSQLAPIPLITVAIPEYGL